ncbi:MAG: ABC transporter substrate-binding protein [Sphaerobacter sp.]|nr:ABC transporter substrate-binding protein [Sphaerobacter sp.]
MRPHDFGDDPFDRVAHAVSTTSLTRRTLLRGGVALGFTTAAGALLAACGGGGSSATSTPAGESGGGAPAGGSPTATTAASGDGAPQRGGSITVALNSDLTTMDPHKSTAAVDRQVYQLIYDKLVDIDAQLNIVPYLAERWEIADDGKQYTFTLVSGVTFHDGEPLNAAAVKANFDRMLDPATASPRRSEVAQVTEVQAPDDTTVVLVLSQPYAPLLATLSDRAGMIISPKAIQEKGDDLAREPVGSGAFVFVEWVKDDHLTVKRNENYWQEGLPYLDQVTYKPVTDATVRLTSLRTNEVQMVDAISAKDVEATKNDPSLVYSEVAGLAFQYISLNSSKPPFDKKELRQAVAWTIDREAIINAIFFGIGHPAQTPIPPSSWAYDESVQVYHQDYDKAKELLAAGGAPDGFEFTMLVTNTPDAIQLAEAYRAQMAAVGINAKLELLEFGTLLDRNDAGDFQAVSLQWSGRPDPDGNIYNYFITDGGLNRGKYSNPEVDRLLEQTRAVADPAERKKLYAEVCRLIAEDAPMIFIRFPAEIKVWQPVIQGFVHVPDGMMRLKTVWLRQ